MNTNLSTLKLYINRFFSEQTISLQCVLNSKLWTTFFFQKNVLCIISQGNQLQNKYKLYNGDATG